MPRIFIDGSSTAYGLWGGPEGGWGDRVKRAHMPDAPDEHNKRSLWTVHTLATSFRTVEDIRRELPPFMKAYRRGDKALVGVVMSGQIESRRPGGASEAAMPIERYMYNLRRLASMAISSTSSLILVGTSPIDPAKTSTFGRFGDTYDLGLRTAYNEAARAVADEHDISYVDVMDPLLEAQAAGQNIMDNDGLHPNPLGHTIIYNAVHPVIESEVARLLDYNNANTL